MFSSIPLPKTIADVGPGGPLVTAMGGMNALTKSNLDNQVLAAQAQYAPYQAYADAQLKNQQAIWTPYQYRMQAAANPLLWQAAKDNPALQQQLNSMMSAPIMGAGGGFGSNGMNIPMPGQRSSNPLGNGFAGMLWNKLTGGAQAQGNGQQQSNNPMAQMQPSGGQSQGGSSSYPSFGANNPISPQEIDKIAANGNGGAQGSGGSPAPAQSADTSSAPASQSSSGTPLLPASTDNAVGGTLTAHYNSGPFKPSDLVWDSKNGKIISNASDAVIQQAQQGLSGLQRIDPLIRRLAVEQNPLQSGWNSLLSDVEGLQNRWGPKDWNKYFPQFEKQYPDIAKSFNLKGLALPTLQARAESDIATGPEQLIRIYGLKTGKYSIQDLKKTIQPVSGETGDQYTQRLMQKISQMQQEEGAPYKQQLAQGFAVGGNNQNPSRGGGGGSATSQAAANNTNSAQMWPAEKDALNENDPNIEGHTSPPGTIWMIRPDGYKVPVHQSRINEARSHNYRGINQ